jgi:hypothetical protein
MLEHSSINIKVGRDMSGVLNLGTISGNVSNTINKLPESPDQNREHSSLELSINTQAR